jgi:Icc-related predicted phosphoesterase
VPNRKLVLISDTHNKHGKLAIPDGDFLIHAGDMTGRGTEKEIREFNQWLGTLPHKHKIVIAGNHDYLFESNPELAKGLLSNAIYLENSGVEIDGIKFWGSPFSPKFLNMAFNAKRGIDLKKYWDLIPDDTDVLIVHTPPYGILDKTSWRSHVGCHDLAGAVSRVKPELVIFGHIHEAYGVTETNGTRYINASSLTKFHLRMNTPVEIEL